MSSHMTISPFIGRNLARVCGTIERGFADLAYRRGLLAEFDPLAAAAAQAAGVSPAPTAGAAPVSVGVV